MTDDVRVRAASRWRAERLCAIGLALMLATIQSPMRAAAQGACGQWVAGNFPVFGVDSTGVAGGTVFDDGSGPALYVCGEFTTIGDTRARSVARWNGSHWTRLGDGISNNVLALAVFDDGSGPALYAGGFFSRVGLDVANGIARWNGSTWSEVGGGVSQNSEGLPPIVSSMVVWDDGTGPALYVVGWFGAAGGVTAHNIARWKAGAWSAVGPDITITAAYAVPQITVFNDAVHGSSLIISTGGEALSGATPLHSLVAWNGTSWNDMGGGVEGPPPFFPSAVWAMTSFDDGSGPSLFVGGQFRTAGGVAALNIARFDGTSWHPLGGGVGHQLAGGNVFTLAGFDDGSGPVLIAGGLFDEAGGQAILGVAQWDGVSWDALGDGVSLLPDPIGTSVDYVIEFDDGSGPSLYAFTNGSVGLGFDRAGDDFVHKMARWNGTAWSAIQPGMSGCSVNALLVHDDGSGAALYMGGELSIAGARRVHNVASWNGSQWSDVGGGIADDAAGNGGRIRALAEFDDGSGVALYAAGSFGFAGGVPAHNLAKWDGTSWSPLGVGVSNDAAGNGGEVTALNVYDDGSGSALYAAGEFQYAGGTPARRIAKWNGASWSSVGVGFGANVNALVSHDDGSGLALYAGGDFDHISGDAFRYIARWTGSTWEALGDEYDHLQGSVTALTVADVGAGPQLIAGGPFAVGLDFFPSTWIELNFITRWTGAEWLQLSYGLDNYPYALYSFVDGTGPALAVGGVFTHAGLGFEVYSVARYSIATDWTALDRGLYSSGFDQISCNPVGTVKALVTFDAGLGPDLFCGGGMSQTVGDTFGGTVPPIATHLIAQWRPFTRPVISADPESQTVCQGRAVGFSVTATGPGSLSYQWRRNGANISGATSSTYSIPSVTPAHAGNYTVVVTNSCGSTTSNAATLAVLTTPTISVHPTSRSACLGSSTTFSVTASGGGLSYRWRRNGLDVAGATSASFVITEIAQTDAGTYDVVVTNSCGAATSNAATLTVVEEPPSIASHPSSLAVCTGGGATFTVSATGGAPLAYQWRRNATPIAGATSSSYSIPSVAPAHAGSYEVVVTNPCGSVTSNAATLTVGVAPAITTQPSSRTACTGTSTTFTVSASGTPTLAYQWRKNGVVIAGATASMFTIGSVTTGDAGTYDVVVTNSCGFATSNGATLTVQSGPAITSSPTSRTTCLGASTTFLVSATGTAPLSYQWRRNGSSIAGATGASYTIATVTLADAGNYDCVVTNGCGSSTSSVAILTVATPPTITSQPSLTGVCEGSPANFTVVATGSGLTYQWRKDGGAIPGATGSSLVINAAHPSDVGSYDVVVTSSAGCSVTSSSASLLVFSAAECCRRGNVNLAQPSAMNFVPVLRINGAPENARGGIVNVFQRQSINVSLAACPGGPATNVPYAIWVWIQPASNLQDLVIGGNALGCINDPTPFNLGRTPQPFKCVTGGVGPEYQGSVPRLNSPAGAPWSLTRSQGFARVITFGLHGVIRDDSAAAQSRGGWSVTNGILLNIR